MTVLMGRDADAELEDNSEEEEQDEEFVHDDVK